MVEASLQEIENIQHDNLIPFSGPGGRRFKSSLPNQFVLSRFFDSTNKNLLIPSASCPPFAKNVKNGAATEENG